MKCAKRSGGGRKRKKVEDRMRKGGGGKNPILYLNDILRTIRVFKIFF